MGWGTGEWSEEGREGAPVLSGHWQEDTSQLASSGLGEESECLGFGNSEALGNIPPSFGSCFPHLPGTRQSHEKGPRVWSEGPGWLSLLADCGNPFPSLAWFLTRPGGGRGGQGLESGAGAEQGLATGGPQQGRSPLGPPDDWNLAESFVWGGRSSPVIPSNPEMQRWR